MDSKSSIISFLCPRGTLKVLKNLQELSLHELSQQKENVLEYEKLNLPDYAELNDDLQYRIRLNATNLKNVPCLDVLKDFNRKIKGMPFKFMDTELLCDIILDGKLVANLNLEGFDVLHKLKERFSNFQPDHTLQSNLLYPTSTSNMLKMRCSDLLDFNFPIINSRILNTILTHNLDSHDTQSLSVNGQKLILLFYDNLGVESNKLLCGKDLQLELLYPQSDDHEDRLLRAYTTFTKLFSLLNDIKIQNELSEPIFHIDMLKRLLYETPVGFNDGINCIYKLKGFIQDLTLSSKAVFNVTMPGLYNQSREIDAKTVQNNFEKFLDAISSSNRISKRNVSLGSYQAVLEYDEGELEQQQINDLLNKNIKILKKSQQPLDATMAMGILCDEHEIRQKIINYIIVASVVLAVVLFFVLLYIAFGRNYFMRRDTVTR